MRRTAPNRITPAVAALVAAIFLSATAHGAGLPPNDTGEVLCGPGRTAGSSRTHGGGGLMVPTRLDEATDESSVIVVGRVTGFQACKDKTTGSIYTLVRLAPEQVLKGTAGGSVTIEVPGGSYGGFVVGVGTSPEFTAGERAVVFAGMQEGRLVPVRGYQGKLTVRANGAVAGTPDTLDRLVDKVRMAAQGRLVGAENVSLSGAAVESTAWVPLGPKWGAGAIPIGYFMNVETDRPAQLSAADVRKAIAGAMHTWQKENRSYMAFGPLAQTTRTSAENRRCDLRNDIAFGIDEVHSAGALAVTFTCYSAFSMEVQDADIEIDVDHFGGIWRTNGLGNCDANLQLNHFDLETVFLHELGHVLGLGHPSFNGDCTPCPVMDGIYGGVQRTLCPDDGNGVAALYPWTVGAPPEVPGNLQASRTQNVLLNWTKVSDELGYEIWRAPLPCALTLPADFDLLDSVADGVQAYGDTDNGSGLDPQVTYCYRVRSFSTNGNSGFSDTALAAGTPLPENPNDTNCDGSVDAADALGILRHVGGLTGGPACIGMGDANCDEAINAKDALRLLRILAGLSQLC